MCCNPNAYEESNPLIGVVLAGGSSSRMGQDKGLLDRNGKTWCEIAIQKLEEIGIPAVVSINPTQQSAYLKLFPERKLVLDRIGIQGPLEGLLSVHDQYPENDLLVVACDMPDITTNLIKELVCTYQDKAGEHDFLVYSKEGQLEPLLGVYTAEGLAKVFSLYLTKQLEKQSMKYVLQEGNTFSIELPESKREELKNFNSSEDLLN